MTAKEMAYESLKVLQIFVYLQMIILLLDFINNIYKQNGNELIWTYIKVEVIVNGCKRYKINT